MNKFKVKNNKLTSFSFLRLFWDRVAAAAWRTSTAGTAALARRLVASDLRSALDSLLQNLLVSVPATTILVSI